MFTKKKAFTLSEILIILAIMSIITVLMIQNNKNLKLGYKTLYYFTLKNMQQASGQLISESTYGVMDLHNPTFCNKFLRVFNSVGYDSVCSTQYTGSSLVSPFAGITKENLDTPTFVISNGQRVYVYDRIEGSPGYRIINVDLNGKAGPNDLDQDVVAFAIFDNGNVLPLGTAADSKDYLMVRDKTMSRTYGTQRSPGFVLSDEEPKTNILSYREGVCKAGYTFPYSTTYCSNSSGINEKEYLTDDNCVPNNNLTFCQVQYVKPLININM